MAPINPEDQFQLGDLVYYIDQAVVAIVSGYLWSEEASCSPKILGYHLSCGCTVMKKDIKHYENELNRSGSKRKGMLDS